MSTRIARFTAAFQALLLMATLLLPALTSAAVWTDLPDYAPGSVVTIHGDNSNDAGYLPGETVDVSVNGPNDYQASCNATADELGSWACDITLWGSSDAIGDYSYVAVGRTSGATETGTFTDATNTNTAVSGSPNPSNGGSVTITATVTASGGGAITSGTVDFRDAATNCSNGTLLASGVSLTVAGTASIATSSLTSGSHTIRACYSGSGSGGSAINASNGTYVQVVDTTAPSVIAFSCVPTGPSTNATTLACTVTFNETVSGFALTDVTVGGTSTTWSKSGLTGTGPYSFVVSRSAPNTDGSLTLQVVAGAVSDLSGNSSSASSTLTYAIDTSAPTVTSLSCTPTPGITNQTSLSCAVTFSETVSVFQNGDVTVGGTSAAWSVSGAAGSGASYTFTASRGGSNKDGSLTLQIAAGAVTDGSGNPSAASGSLAYNIDTNAPNIPSITGNPGHPTTSTSATFNFSASDPLDNGYASGVSLYQCQIDGGGYSACASGINFPGLGAGAHSFQVRAVDVAGNTGASASFAWTIDLTAPSISSFTCVPAPGTTSDTTIDCSVTFSESVSGFVANSSDVNITGGSSGWSAGATAGSNAGPYTFTVSRAGSVDGDLHLQIAAGAVTDLAGNASTAASSVLDYTIDTVGPTATLSCTPLGSPTNATSFACQVMFSDPVTGFSSTTSDLIIGGTIPDSVDWDPLASTGSGAGPYFFTVNRTAPNKDGNLSFQIAAGAAVDALGNGNSASNTLTFLIDTHGPVVVLNSTPTDPSNAPSGSFGFTAADPTSGTANGVSTGVAYTECQIDGGGWAACSSPAPYGPLLPGPHTFDVRGVDNVGNTGATTSFSWTVLPSDSDGPVISISTTALDNGNGWFNIASSGTSGIDVAVSASDVSGVASFECAVDGGTATAYDPTGDTINLGDGEHTVACNAEDTLGNGSNDSADFDVDQTAPSVTVTPDRPADYNGWYNADVVFDTAGTDDTSGVDDADCTADQTYSGPDGQDLTVDGSCTDGAGNSANGTSDAFDFDSTDPTATVDPDRIPDHAGWYNADVTFTTNGSDNLSGIEDCTDPQLYSGPDGTGLTVSGSCTDNAGNSTGTVSSAAFDFDNTDPSVTVTPDRPADYNGWYNADVVFDTAGTDDTSGVDDADCTADQTYSGPDGQDLTVDGSCTDGAGNSANGTSDAFDFDSTDPGITLFSRLPAANGNGWNNSAVTVIWTCSDATSGPASPTATDTKSSEGASQTANGTCTDNAGNSSSASIGSINIDLTAPTAPVYVGGPAAGGTYYFGFVPAAPTCTSSDALSGLTPAGCTVSGWSNAIGTHVMTASATDKAGNTSTTQRTYTVLAWTVNGFYNPVDMGGFLNIVKGGSTVPLKFEIFAGPTELTSVSYIQGFQAREMACGALTFLTADDIEITSTGGTTLRYDSTGGQFIQNWQTPKNKVGTCWVVTMTALDGTSLNAFFKLK